MLYKQYGKATRDYTLKESEEAAKKLDDMSVESMDFMKGDEAPAGMDIGSAIPQPPGYPLPARKYGLPSWETEVQNMIENAMLSSTGEIATEQDLENVKNRLRYLLSYQPNLSGEMRIRCDTAIRLLKDRVTEYKHTNINQFIRTIANFVGSPIRKPEQLAEAEGYLGNLTQRRLKLAGDYARGADVFICRLKARIAEYQEVK